MPGLGMEMIFLALSQHFHTIFTTLSQHHRQATVQGVLGKIRKEDKGGVRGDGSFLTKTKFKKNGIGYYTPRTPG